MCYTDYNEFVGYINKKYEEYTKSHQRGSFSRWIKNLVDTNPSIKADFDEFVIYRKNESEPNYRPKDIHPKSGKPMYNKDNDLPDFIAKIISHAFYADRIPDDTLERKKHRRIRELNHNRDKESPWTNIRNYCLGTEIPLDIDEFKPYCSWVEICSAFQKRYGIFGSLDDLNKFVFAVGSESVFSNCGFYMRDLTHICLAYSILHGYSIDEEKLLLQRATEAVGRAHREVSREERSAKNTYTEEAREVFEQWFNINKDQVKSFKCGDDNEKNFIQDLSDNCKYIITKIIGYNHWSALKIVLDTLFRNNDDDECVEDIERKFKDRLLALYGEVADLNNIDMAWLCSVVEEHSFREYLIKSLGIDKMARIYKVASNATQKFSADNNTPEMTIKKQDGLDIIADSLRYVYIVALMKQIKNKDNYETTMAAIQYINKKLAEVGMREIEDYTKIGNNAIPTDMPKDFVDGFIVECICYEEKRCFDVVSGFDTFMQYILKR